MGRNTLYREQFDLCVSRAVANLSSLSEYCIPFVKTGGAFISYKSGEVDEEATQAKRAIYLLGGEVKDIYKFDLFDQKRSFVVIEREEDAESLSEKSRHTDKRTSAVTEKRDDVMDP